MASIILFPIVMRVGIVVVDHSGVQSKNCFHKTFQRYYMTLINLQPNPFCVTNLHEIDMTIFFPYITWILPLHRKKTSTLPETNSKSTWKWMVGIRIWSFPWGRRPIFRGELLVAGTVQFFGRTTTTLSTSLGTSRWDFHRFLERWIGEDWSRSGVLHWKWS